ncbi:12532_t:CDS:1, partial [Funneliformis geosporum]
QIRDIHLDIEELLTREVNRYYNKKNRQKIKIKANTSSDGSSTLFRLDGFEKQLEECELRVQQWENNIKKTIEAQVAEERKRLKDECDALMFRKESEYNNCMVDMKQKTYLFKHQLEEQQKSGSDDLERQYKSRIYVLDKSNAVKDKEIGKLSASIFQLKNDKNALKKDFASVKKTIKILDGIIYSKDKTIIAYNEGLRKIKP